MLRVSPFLLQAPTPQSRVFNQRPACSSHEPGAQHCLSSFSPASESGANQTEQERSLSLSLSLRIRTLTATGCSTLLALGNGTDQLRPWLGLSVCIWPQAPMGTTSTETYVLQSPARGIGGTVEPGVLCVQPGCIFTGSRHTNAPTGTHWLAHCLAGCLYPRTGTVARRSTIRCSHWPSPPRTVMSTPEPADPRHTTKIKPPTLHSAQIPTTQTRARANGF